MIISTEQLTFTPVESLMTLILLLLIWIWGYLLGLKDYVKR